MNVVVLCGRDSSLLWSLPPRIKISLDMIRFKDIFCVCIGCSGHLMIEKKKVFILIFII